MFTFVICLTALISMRCDCAEAFPQGVEDNEMLQVVAAGTTPDQQQPNNALEANVSQKESTEVIETTPSPLPPPPSVDVVSAEETTPESEVITTPLAEGMKPSTSPETTPMADATTVPPPEAISTSLPEETPKLSNEISTALPEYLHSTETPSVAAEDKSTTVEAVNFKLASTVAPSDDSVTTEAFQTESVPQSGFEHPASTAAAAELEESSSSLEEEEEESTETIAASKQNHGVRNLWVPEASILAAMMMTHLIGKYVL